MRRSIAYSFLGTLSFASGYATTIAPPEPILVQTVPNKHRQVAAALVVQKAKTVYPESRILFVGDMMFDRTIRKVGESSGYDFLFSCVAESFGDVDGIIGNLEGPVTAEPSISIHKKVGEVGNTQFTFSEKSIASLASHGFVAVSIGNNHIRDFGRQGILSTRKALDEQGIAYTGDPTDSATDATEVVINGVPVTLIAYNQFLGSKASTLGALKKNLDKTTVVFAHWGEEYTPATKYQKDLAKEFVAAGADLVIGAHPHVVQESEVIHGVPVFYSLGNFIFDQYWTGAVRSGLGVAVLFTKDGVMNVEQIPFSLMSDRRTCKTQSHE